MTQLVWGNISDKNYTNGIDRGMFYTPDGNGLVWNGLVSFTETETPYESVSYFLDGQKYLQKASSGDFSAALTAITYPDIFEEYSDAGFGLSYRTYVHSDFVEDYQLHILYNLQAHSTELVNQTINNSPQNVTFQWDITSLPVNLEGFKPYSHLIIDSRYAYPWLMQELESILYGTSNIVPRLPPMYEILEIFERNSILQITDHGDGSWTAEGPDEVVSFLDSTTFQINWPSVIFLNPVTYQVSSL